MKGKSYLGIILSILVIAGAIYLAMVGIGEKHTGSAKDISLGLDLEGGVSITYTTVKDANNENPEATAVDDTVYKLQKRLDEKGYTEGEVYKEGADRITVAIPGVTDANKVLEELGQMGLLEFIDEAGVVLLTGADVENAIAQNTPTNVQSPYNIGLELNEQGKQKFADATTANVGKVIYIYYNGVEIMHPSVEEPILDGNAQISRLNSMEEASAIASTIRIGALPLELEELSSNVVGAKMGQDAIKTSVKAGLIGILVVFLFMIFFYRLPGLVADITLAFYAGLMIIIISFGNITLTLPGIAGIILSIGMAVDANVIIFARIREELAQDKTLRASVKAGYKKAFSAIFDGNITTFIAALILFFMGTGPIRGFAMTLGLGIVVSMFTALIVSRIIMTSLVNIGFRNKVLYGLPKELRTIKVTEKIKNWFTISLIVIVVGCVMMVVNLATTGKVLIEDIEFAGGTSTVVSLPAGVSYDSYEALETDVKEMVITATGDETPQFQNVKGVDQFIIKTTTLDTTQRIALEDALKAKYSIGTESIESQSISATISTEMKKDAIIAVLLATLFILVYVTFRFKDYRFGVSSVIALFHDIFIVIAVYAVFKINIDNAFIVAILTILGYSINDTIVVFDRIRENQKHMKRGDFHGVVNSSVTQTLSRSINTSLTTFLMILFLYIFGVQSIKDFALPLMVGIVSGTYSSIFVASPLWYLFKKKEESKIQKAQQSV